MSRIEQRPGAENRLYREVLDDFNRPPTLAFIRHYFSDYNLATSDFSKEPYTNIPSDHQVKLSNHPGAWEQFCATYDFLRKLKMPEYKNIYFIGGPFYRVNTTVHMFDELVDEYRHVDSLNNDVNELNDGPLHLSNINSFAPGDPRIEILAILAEEHAENQKKGGRDSYARRPAPEERQEILKKEYNVDPESLLYSDRMQKLHPTRYPLRKPTSYERKKREDLIAKGSFVDFYPEEIYISKNIFSSSSTGVALEEFLHTYGNLYKIQETKNGDIIIDREYRYKEGESILDGVLAFSLIYLNLENLVKKDRLVVLFSHLSMIRAATVYLQYILPGKKIPENIPPINSNVIRNCSYTECRLDVDNNIWRFSERYSYTYDSKEFSDEELYEKSQARLQDEDWFLKTKNGAKRTRNLSGDAGFFQT